MLIANKGFESLKAAAEFLGIKHMTLYKIIKGVNHPTARQGIVLCQKCGYSANWLFLNIGPAKLVEAVSLDKIETRLRAIEQKVAENANLSSLIN